MSLSLESDGPGNPSILIRFFSWQSHVQRAVYQHQISGSRPNQAKWVPDTLYNLANR